jgi:hypothetical protein
VGGHHYGYRASGIDELVHGGRWVLVPLMYADDLRAATELWPDALRVLVRADAQSLQARFVRRYADPEEAARAFHEATEVAASLEALPWDLEVDCGDNAGDGLPRLMAMLEAAR